MGLTIALSTGIMHLGYSFWDLTRQMYVYYIHAYYIPRKYQGDNGMHFNSYSAKKVQCLRRPIMKMLSPKWWFIDIGTGKI